MTIKFGMLEDDTEIRKYYSRYLSKFDTIDCIIEAGSVEAFIEKMASITQLDVVLADIGLPGKSGIEGIYQIKQKFPDCNILMFSVYNDSERIFQALRAGATGYLLKNTPLTKLPQFVEAVHAGDAPMSPSIARKVIEYFTAPQKVSRKAEAESLTPREQQIVRALVDGLSYKMIAHRYDISFETVKQHIKNIYRKLQVNSKAEVIVKSMRGEI